VWDVRQYEKFRDERSRPFFDLLGRVPDRSFKRIADLGCGTGDLTLALAEHWPTARVTGVDLSTEMLAASRGIPGRLDFAQGDLSKGDPAGDFDLFFSNAAYQWVPGHDVLIPALARRVPAEGVLAVQIPTHYDSPAHRELEALASEPRWREVLAPRQRPRTEPLADYVRMLRREGLQVDGWETMYGHVLPSPMGVVEWMKGTALRPSLALLDEAARGEFLAAYAKRLVGAFPDVEGGILFPFRRLFFVAVR
jgi:trans-aconitate 2-methyltransferase